MSTPFPSSPTADADVPGTCGDIRFVPAVTVEPVGGSPDVPTREPHPSIPDSPPTPPRRDESSLPLEEDPRSTHFIPEPVYPPYDRLLSEGCTVRQKAPKSDTPIYSFRQDRVGSEFDHRRFRDHRGAATRAGRAVISVDEYCKYPVFDARRFRAVSPVVGLEVNGKDGWVNDKDRAETWNQRWVHSGCRIPVPIHMDLKFLRRTSERQYCERLGRMFQHYRVRNFSEKTPSEPDITLLCYGDSPSQGLYWFGQRTRFGSDAAQESRIRVRSLLRGSRSFMWTWNCDEFFDVPPGLRKELYPMALRTWGKYECPQYLCVPTPAVYAYYGSYVTLRAAGAFANRRAEFVHAVGLTEFAASAVLCWLLAARDGVRYECRAPDPRLFPSGLPNFPSGRLFHLSAVLITLIRSVGVEALLRGSPFLASDFDSCVASNRATCMLPERDFCVFDWSTKQVVTLPPPLAKPVSDDTYHLLPTFRDIMVNRAAASSSESQPTPVSRPPVSIPPATRADTPVWEYDPNRAYLCESPEMRQLPPSTGIRSVPRPSQPAAASHAHVNRDTGVRALNMQGLLRLRRLRATAQYDEQVRWLPQKEWGEPSGWQELRRIRRDAEDLYDREVTVSFEGVQEAARSAGIDPPSDVPMALKLLTRLLRRDIPAETARLDQLTERVRAVFDEYSEGMPQKRARTN